MNSVQWSRKVMLLNSLLFYPAIVIGGYALWYKSLTIFAVYVALWIVVLTAGRYLVCRRCKYYGKDCPTFGFSYIARIFRRDESKGFSGRACHIDIAAIGITLFLPTLTWILSAFNIVTSYSNTDHAIMGVYQVLALLMLGVHSATGCNRCDIAECSFSKAAKEGRTKADRPS